MSKPHIQLIVYILYMIDCHYLWLIQEAPDPTANLTFKLSLTDHEKEVRANTELPYTKSEKQKEHLLNKGSAKIFYTPDEADDYDA